MELPEGEDSMILSGLVLSQYQCVTDGRTDTTVTIECLLTLAKLQRSKNQRACGQSIIVSYICTCIVYRTIDSQEML